MIIYAYLVVGLVLLLVTSLVMWWLHEGLTRELIVVAAIVFTLILLPILTVLTLLALHSWRL